MDLEPDGVRLQKTPSLPRSGQVSSVPSISLYNADGYFDRQADGPVSVNSLTAVPNPDGSTTVHCGGSTERPNRLSIMEGWNYIVRLYRPRPQVLDGTWTFPEIETQT